MKKFVMMALLAVPAISQASVGSCAGEFVCTQIQTEIRDIVEGMRASCTAEGYTWSDSACASEGSVGICINIENPAMTLSVHFYNLPNEELEQVRQSCQENGGRWE